LVDRNLSDKEFVALLASCLPSRGGRRELPVPTELLGVFLRSNERPQVLLSSSPSAREGGQRGGGGGGEETHEKELANVSASQRDLRLLCGGDGVGKGSAARADCF
jgi:hypothetical protein